MIIVPKIINEHVNRLIDKLSIKATPFYIDVKPEQGFQIDACFNNVKAKISKDDGEIIYGWSIWQHIFMIEAEFHAVWKSPNGEFLDITPKKDNEKRILFVIDNNRKYENRQVDNIRLKTIENKLADDFITLAKAKYSIMNKGERADTNGQILVSREEAMLLQDINDLMVRVNNMLLNNKTRNSMCFCNTGRKYKNCHGQDLIEKLRKLIVD